MNQHRCLLAVLAVGVGSLAACQAPQPEGRLAASLKTQALTGTQGNPLHPRVKMETSLGDIILELDAEQAPITVLHFLDYVQANSYDGTIFHRVRKDSLIQGGAFTPDMTRKATTRSTAFANGWSHSLKSRRGTIALLHKDTLSGTESADFFINLVDKKDSDPRQSHSRFAVFGSVVEGLETVERIGNTPVNTHPDYAAGRSAVVPLDPIVIKSVRLITAFDRERVEATIAVTKEQARDPLGKLIKKLEQQAGKKVVTTESGLRYVDLVIGTGPRPLPTEYVEYQYRGTLLDGTEFESTYQTKPAFSQVDGLIPGLREGLTTMNEGGRRTVIIPPELAYGASGIPGYIPPYATLVFEIELLAIR